MRILIKGGGFSNKGDEAMMRTAQRELAKRIPHATFCLRLPYRQIERAHAAGFQTIAIDPFGMGRIGKWLRAWLADPGRFRSFLTSRVAGMEMAEIGPVDAVVDISGFGYSDVWGPHFSVRGMTWAAYCVARGKPFICLPQAWGPFTNPDVARHTADICRRAKLVYARDRISLEHLQRVAPDRADDIALAPDIAFRHQGALPEVGTAILSSLGVRLNERPIIALTPNMRIYHRTRGEGRTNEYVRFMTEIGRYCLEKWHATLVLIPHEMTAADRPKVDDRFLCGLIELSLATPERCVSLTENYSSDQMKSVISRLDMVIGSRFHSLVFALSSRVPTVAVGWAHKYSELMELFGLRGNVLEHESLDWAAMRRMLDTAWQSRDATRELLAGRLPGIIGQVDDVFDRAAAAIAGVHR